MEQSSLDNECFLSVLNSNGEIGSSGLIYQEFPNCLNCVSVCIFFIYFICSMSENFRSILPSPLRFPLCSISSLFIRGNNSRGSKANFSWSRWHSVYWCNLLTYLFYWHNNSSYSTISVSPFSTPHSWLWNKLQTVNESTLPSAQCIWYVLMII